jgi:5,10-methylenetetrahydromethanopterin reductase
VSVARPVLAAPSPSGRELGLGLQTDKQPGEYGALARLADEAGFAVVTAFNDLWFQPALPALLEIAAATSRVRIGPSCLNPFAVHPVEIAGQTAALDAASDGRAFVGLARGAWLETLGVDQSDPVTAIREAWEVVRRLLAGDDSGFAGRRFSLPRGERLRYSVRRREVPLLVGTWGPRLAAFAGEAAQELKVGGSANPDLVPVVRERIGNPEVGIVLGAVTVVDQDGELARRIARREVAMYFGVVAELDPTVPIEPELVARVRALVGAGDLDGAGALIPDDALDRFAFAGTPEQVALQVEAVFGAGARRIDFGTPHGIPESRGLELLCTEVLPRLRSTLGAAH